jgi:hypothetical protein
VRHHGLHSVPPPLRALRWRRWRCSLDGLLLLAYPALRGDSLCAGRRPRHGRYGGRRRGGGRRAVGQAGVTRCGPALSGSFSALAELYGGSVASRSAPHHETFSTTIQPPYNSAKG